ncbi:acyl-CoA synthetase short-chain family member 3, mitochondrial-like isoform X2 [Babylonia areolata]|uniref:acyl-CoA synthetase short-chain family member 3, mitochondrial-like isoform X2 n=1 Tax=Babylonia areolata TaxID=304850 RepID=UPI003FD2A890
MAGYIRTLHRDFIYPAARLYRSTLKPGLLDRLQNQTCLTRALSLTSTRHRYDDVFRQSVERPEDFWAEAAEQIVWTKKWDKVLDDSNPPFSKWFVGGELNTCYNALDRHVEGGRGDQTAIIHDSPVTRTITHTSYKELLEKVRLLAGVLMKHGVQKGDRVLIYMPMIPEAIVAMLACARIGAIHSLVFGGFASKELAARINHAQPKVVVSANCGVEPTRTVPYKPMLDGALDLSEFQPPTCIIFNRPQFEASPMKAGRDVCWEDEMAGSSPVDCVPVSATDPIYLLYTSGTTGLPKAVVRPSGGHAVVLHWSMDHVYGVKPGDVWWAASDLGWVVGHSYICYGPLLHGNTSIVFEGKPVGTPDPGTFFRVIHDHDVKGMFTAPTAIRAIRAEDPEGEYAKSFLPYNTFQALFLAGEHCDHETMDWIRDLIQKPVLDNWWQTESGWPITSTCFGLNMHLFPPPGVTGKPVPGWNVKVMDEEGRETEDGELGEIFIKLPLPPGAFSTLWEADERFKETYFSQKEGYYATMDAGVRDEHGYISVLSRNDDVINVAGHRLSAGALEEAILEFEDVVEAAVIGVPDRLKGQVPVGLCVVQHGCQLSNEEVVEGVVKVVRKMIGPVAAFKIAVVVPKLPKTRSGKVARNTLAAMAAGKPFQVPVTIEDASVYPAIRECLLAVGLAK